MIFREDVARAIAEDPYDNEYVVTEEGETVVAAQLVAKARPWNPERGEEVVHDLVDYDADGATRFIAVTVIRRA